MSYHRKVRGVLSFIIVLFVAFCSYLLVNSEIVENKVDESYSFYESQKEEGFEGFSEGTILNRFGMLQIGFENFLSMPLGHGLNQSGLQKTATGAVLEGPNTFAWLMQQWGIIFLLTTPIFLYRFFIYFLRERKTFDVFIGFVIILIWMNSSMPTRDYLFFSIFFIGYLKLVPPKHWWNIVYQGKFS